MEFLDNYLIASGVFFISVILAFIIGRWGKGKLKRRIKVGEVEIEITKQRHVMVPTYSILF